VAFASDASSWLYTDDESDSNDTVESMVVGDIGLDRGIC
jgi:hypothetical protein